MNIFTIIFLASILAACQTPQSVVDTAALVAKMTTQLNGELTEYVNKQNEIRSEDISRLTRIRLRTDRLMATNQDQFDIIRLTSSSDMNHILDGIKAGRVADSNIGVDAPAVRYSRALTAEFGKNNFEGGLLNSVSTTAGSIAKPSTAVEQLMSLEIGRAHV